MRVAACMKWVDTRPEIDALTGAVHGDDRFRGASSADLAALEWAMRIAERTGGSVLAISAGPPAADRLLRDALAAGADQVLRVELGPAEPSRIVAAALAAELTERDVDVVVCGDWSIDRGSGSVPAFVAGELGAAQALGLVALDVAADETMEVERRLDHGRRERLRVRAPAVLSVEGGAAELRRAPLRAVLAAESSAIPSVRPGHLHRPITRVTERGPFRPRARELPPPAADLGPRERILELTGAHLDAEPPRTIAAEPDEAAGLLVDQLRRWGYLDET
ncbi:MAG: mycofactocin-associated electron transfer flavoprotein beta subunit [Actinomycetota bacterium]|nr:mycofactocin-associated electron transfer flavoprotein beta subunit [Actinomycetota bacterium]